MIWDLNEKQLAEFYKKYLETDKVNFPDYQITGIPDFENEYNKINFELFQQECEKLGYHAKKGCDIKSKSKFYKNQWNKFKTVFIFETDESNL